MLRLLKRLMPGSLKRRLGGVLAARRSLAADQALNRLDRRLQQRHVDGCQLLANRTGLLSRLPAGGVVAEVGVAEGLFSRQILEYARPKTLHLIDMWSAARPGYDDAEYVKLRLFFSAPEFTGRVIMHRGISWEEIAKLPEGSLDWIYVDAGHIYEDVRRDLAAAMRAIKADGFIAGHDYVRWSSPNGRFGVVEAVNELCINDGFVFRYLTLESNMHLSYAVQRPA